MRHVIWHNGYDDVPHKSDLRTDSLEEAIGWVLAMRKEQEGGRRRYKRVWIGYEDSGGVMGSFVETEEVRYEDVVK